MKKEANPKCKGLRHPMKKEATPKCMRLRKKTSDEKRCNPKMQGATKKYL
jgi:hypothetical protein